MVMILFSFSTFIGCGKKEEPNGSKIPSSTSEPIERQATTQAGVSTGSWITVERGSIKEFVPAVGSFLARQTTQVGSQVSGRVQEVLVDVGDKIRKDQPVVRLDPTFFDIELAQAKAKLEFSRVAVKDAELNYNRMKNLWEKPGSSDQPSISRKLYDDAKLKYDATQAEFNLTQQALRYAEQRLKETVIRAPYDAVVVKRLVDTGEQVATMPPTSILLVQEIATLNLEFSLPQNMLSSITVGTPFEFEVEGIAEGKGSGKIAVIFPAVDEASRSFRCRAHIENPGTKYRPGLLAQIRVLDKEVQNTLIVPRKAVQQTATGWQALVSNNGHPTAQNIKVGLVTQEQVEIKEGLTLGSKVFVQSGN
ncbi:MAG: efflux RND transporter periplasmic adaptor subunit [Phycisphaerae bacterium]